MWSPLTQRQGNLTTRRSPVRRSTGRLCRGAMRPDPERRRQPPREVGCALRAFRACDAAARVNVAAALGARDVRPKRRRWDLHAPALPAVVACRAVLDSEPLERPADSDQLRLGDPPARRGRTRVTPRTARAGRARPPSRRRLGPCLPAAPGTPGPSSQPGTVPEPDSSPAAQTGQGARPLPIAAREACEHRQIQPLSEVRVLHHQ